MPGRKPRGGTPPLGGPGGRKRGGGNPPLSSRGAWAAPRGARGGAGQGRQKNGSQKGGKKGTMGNPFFPPPGHSEPPRGLKPPFYSTPFLPKKIFFTHFVKSFGFFYPGVAAFLRPPKKRPRGKGGSQEQGGEYWRGKKTPGGKKKKGIAPGV